MPYLITRDYKLQIQDSQLSQLLGNDAVARTYAENRAIEDIKTHLQQKYLIDSEFTNTSVWSNTTVYMPTDRVYLDATAYSNASTYAIGALVLQAGNVYRCATAINTPEPFTINKWTLIGAQYTMFFGAYPKPLFDLYGQYAVGDQVYYNGRQYTCRIATTVTTHGVALQYGTIENLPFNNVLPAGTNQSATYWTDNGAYTIPAGTLPTNTTFWTQGDNRNAQILGFTIDIALYYLHQRIAPQNVPELRRDNFDRALVELKDFAKGDSMTLNVARIQPHQGNRIRFGGNVKNINSY